MGYHLTILRTKGAEEIPIAAKEFATAVCAMPLLRLDDDNRSARYFSAGELRATLTLTDGRVWTNVAEEDVLVVMLELAGRLGARVRGDEMETYRSATEAYQHPDDSDDIDAEEIEQRRRKRRRWAWNVIRVVLLLTVAGLMIAEAMRK